MNRLQQQLYRSNDRSDRLVRVETELSVDEIELLLQDLHDHAAREPHPDPVAQTAQLFQALSTTPTPRPAFADELKQQLLNTYATDQVAPIETPASSWRQWRRWLMVPMLPVGGIAVGVLIWLSVRPAAQTTSTTTQPLAGVAIQNEQSTTTAPHIDLVEFQKILAESAEAQALSEVSIAAESSYATLRRSATETLKADQEIIDFLKKGGMDTTHAQDLHDAFAYDVSHWPADDAPEDAATSQRMIDAFVKNNTEWNKLMGEIIEQLTQQYEERKNQ